MKILVVDDEELIRNVIREYLIMEELRKVPFMMKYESYFK